MRLLILSPPPAARSPLAVQTPLLVDALRRLGCTVDVEPWGAVGREALWRRTGDRVAAAARIARRLRAAPYDVLVVKTTHDWNTLARDLPLLAAARIGCRVVEMHGGHADRLADPLWPAFRLASRVLAAASDALIVCSREEQRAWQAFRPATPVFVARNAFLPPPPPPPRPRQRLGLPVSVPLVLFVGRLLAIKGIDDLLASAAVVRPHIPLHVVVVGEGPHRPALERQVRTLRLHGDVTFTGYLSGEDLAAAYAAADVFAFPSRSEGLPTVLLEAMAARLPIVTTAIRGMLDLIEDGRHGLLIPPRDPGALAAALQRLLQDGALRQRLAAANPARLAAFHPDRVAAEYLALLLDVRARFRR